MSLFSRYSDTKQKEYSSLSQIHQHQPQLLQSNDTQIIEESKGNTQAIVPAMEIEQQGIFGVTKTESQKLFAPTVLLTGHQSEVFSVKFNNTGSLLASAGFDKQVLIWDVYKNCKNTGVLKGHSNAILEVQWSMDGSKLYTAAADKTVCAWDSYTTKRIKKFTGHTGVVNSCHPSRRGLDLVVSASDDCTAKVWDLRSKNAIHDIPHKYQLFSASFSDTVEKICTAGLDNQIRIWDLRKMETEYSLLGHSDSITGMALSHEGSYLLTNSMDQTLRVWDIRPFVVGSRCVKTFTGATHSFEKNLLRVAWSPDGSYISAGSADK